MLNELLKEISHRYMAIDDLLRDVSQVIVFGAGGSGKHAIRVLQELGVTVLRVCDNDREKQGDTVNEILIITPEQLQEYPDTMVLVASDWGGDIGRQLQQLGMKYYYFGFAFDFKRWKSHYVTEQILGAAEQIEAAYALLSDEPSRATYRALLKYRLTLDPAFFLHADFPQYYHPLVLPEGGDTILDGGAWSGDTALEFVRELDRNCTIYSFEPEPGNYQKLLATIKDEKLASVVVPCHVGMWHETTTLSFNTSVENSMQYHVSVNGEQKIEVTSIDDFVRARGLKVDVIKMDIEGAEVNALQGAAETLVRDQPKLMISAYHEPDDMWQVPLMINRINPNYRCYLAHHRQSPLDYVLYAKCAS